MNDTELQAILERAEAATEGPWMKFNDNEGMEQVFGALWCVGNDAYHNFSNDGDAVCIVVTCGGEEDAEFLANARTDLPAVVHELQRARKELDAAQRSKARNAEMWAKEVTDAQDELDKTRGQLEEARELLREWLAADEDTDELTRIPAIMAVKRQTRAFLGAPDAE